MDRGDVMFGPDEPATSAENDKANEIPIFRVCVSLTYTRYQGSRGVDCCRCRRRRMTRHDQADFEIMVKVKRKGSNNIRKRVH